MKRKKKKKKKKKEEATFGLKTARELNTHANHTSSIMVSSIMVSTLMVMQGTDYGYSLLKV